MIWASWVGMRLHEMVFGYALRRSAAKRARNSINPRMHSRRSCYMIKVSGGRLAIVAEFHGLFIKLVIWKVHKGCVVACSLARRLVRRRVSRGLLCGIVRCAMSCFLLEVPGSLP